MIYAGSGNLPHHLYCFVNSLFVRKDGSGFEPCVWFGLHSYPGRAWGCHVMLECGAIYRGVPPHAIAFSNDPAPWSINDAQVWNCYGDHFATLEYDFLSGLRVEARDRGRGTYLFTAVPMLDGYSASPEQSKEFMFVRLDNDRLAILPTNYLIFDDKSFTHTKWPDNMRLNDKVWSSER